MTQIGTIQIAGSTSGNNPEVELNTLAMRFRMCPGDFILTSAGSLACGPAVLGSPATGAGTGGTNVWDNEVAFKWGDPTRLGVVKRVAVDYCNSINASVLQTRLFKCGMPYIFPGSSHFFPTQNNLLSGMVSSMGLDVTGVNPGSGDSSGSLAPTGIAWTISSGASMTGSFQTDAQPIAEMIGAVTNSNTSVPLLQQHNSHKPFGNGIANPLFEARINEHPICLVAGEGLLLQMLSNNSSTYAYVCNLYWEEYALLADVSTF